MKNSAMTRVIGLTMIVGVSLLGTASASASVGDPITASDSCCTYTAASFDQATGTTSTFLNPATADSFHNVTSTDLGPDKKPLFASETKPAGGSSPVAGTKYLAPGTYGFYCTIHTTAMSGDLVVDASGTAVARPSVKLAVPSQKLTKVQSSGRLKVSVKGLTTSQGVAITASTGASKLGSISKVNVTKGAMKTIVIKLSSKGKAAIKNKKKVSVSVKAAVPFGKPASASRKIH